MSKKGLPVDNSAQSTPRNPIDKTENKSYSSLMEDIMNETIELNHACCVCQASLDGNPFNPELKTSHGYCEPCLEAELLKIGGQS